MFTKFVAVLWGVAAGLATANMLHEESATWVWVVVPMLGLMGAIILSTQMLLRNVYASELEIEQARNAGRGASALIVDIKGTNSSSDEGRVYEIDLIVQPHDYPAYRTTMRRLIDPITETHIRPGNVIGVVRVHEHKPLVAYDPKTPPGHISSHVKKTAGAWVETEAARNALRKATRNHTVWSLVLFALFSAAAYLISTYFLDRHAESHVQIAQGVTAEGTDQTVASSVVRLGD